MVYVFENEILTCTLALFIEKKFHHKQNSYFVIKNIDIKFCKFKTRGYCTRKPSILILNKFRIKKKNYISQVRSNNRKKTEHLQDFILNMMRKYIKSS